MSATSLTTDQREVYEAGRRRLLAEMGNVSIVKFLGGESDDEARAIWFAGIDAFLAEIPASASRGFSIAEDGPHLILGDGVEPRLALWELQQDAVPQDSWRILIRPDWVPVVIDALASARWGERWDDELAAATAGRAALVEPAGERPFGGWMRGMRDRLDAIGVPSRGWVAARDANQAGPWPWFADERRARRAGLALTLDSTALAEISARLDVGR